MRRSVLIGGAVVLVAAGGTVALHLAGSHVATSAVDDALKNLPPGYSASHGAISVNPLTGGTSLEKLDIRHNGETVFSADDVTVAGIGAQDAAGVPMRIGHITAHGAGGLSYRHIDRVEIDGLELHNVLALVDPASYPGGKPASTERKPLLGSGELFGVSLQTDVPPQNGRPGQKLDLSIKHMKLAGVSARLFIGPPTREAMKDPLFLADVGRAFAEDEASGEGLTLPVKDAVVTLASESVIGYDGGRLRSFGISGLSIALAKVGGAVTLDGVTAKDLDYTRLLDRLPALVAADPQQMGAVINGAVRIGSGEVHGFKMDVPAVPLVTLESFTGDSQYAEDGTVTSNGTLHGFGIATTGRPLKPAVQAGLQQFGMQDFVLDGGGHSLLNPATGRLKSDDGVLTLRGLGTLHLSYDLDHVPLSQQDPAHLAAAFQNTVLNGAALRWDDASLVGRLFKLASAQTGKSEAELRATISLSLLGLAAMLPDQPDAADQVNAFLDGRHTLAITLAPAAPVRLGDLEAVPPQQKAHVLGVSIKGS